MRARRPPSVLVAWALAGCGAEPVVEPPGAGPVALVVTASDTVTVTGGRLTFAAQPVDSLGRPVGAGTISWSVSNTGRGGVTSDGVFTGGPLPGSVYVRARLAEPPLAESVAVRVVPPGTVKWSWDATEVGDRMPVQGGPALGTDGTVYVLVETGGGPDYPATLVAIGPDGPVRWTLPLLQVVTNYPVVTPGTGRIWVVGKRIYLVAPGGDVLWDTLSGAPVPSFKAGAATTTLLVAAQGYELASYGTDDQMLLWEGPVAPLSGWFVPPTITVDGRVLAKRTADTLFVFAATDGTILRRFPDPDSALDKAVFGVGTVPVGDRYYLPTTKRLAAYDTSGTLLWLTTDTGRGVSEPAVGPDGVLYVQTRIHGLWALNPDGSARWQRPEVQPWSAGQGGAALAEGGILYAGGTDAFYAYRTDGTLLWRFVADTALDADGFPVGRFPGAPAIGPDGTIYTFTSTHVYALWGSAPPEPNSPWPMWRHDAQRTGWAGYRPN